MALAVGGCLYIRFFSLSLFDEPSFLVHVILFFSREPKKPCTLLNFTLLKRFNHCEYFYLMERLPVSVPGIWWHVCRFTS